MSIDFTINGKPYKVKPGEYPPDITLNTFIREKAKLFGTKFQCREGGCGCCTVTVRSHHPVTHQYYTRGVNSCLVLLNTCHGWDIVTIEGLGNIHVGYHPIQERLAHFNGTQCGFCSPGMVMNMFSNLEASRGKLDAETIESSFAGNLCRCTGYRPILDSMKSFASDAEYEFVDNPLDIEDLKICPKVGKICEMNSRPSDCVHVESKTMWYHPTKLSDLFRILDGIKDSRYMLVAGNTAHGVYKRDPNIQVFINVNNVTELRIYRTGRVIELGGNVTLTEMMKVLERSSETDGYEYCKKLLKHLNLVAHVQVRNIGTIAGNLMIKHKHNEFPSDIFLLLLTIGAKIVIQNSAGTVKELQPDEFLLFDMRYQVIVKIILPQIDKNSTLFGTYKIMPRAQNAHAYVNAGFRFGYNGSKISYSRICYGGISPHFNQSTSSVSFFEGRYLFDAETITEALNLLDTELQPNAVLPLPSPEYRKKVALGLFYKFILKNAPAGIVGKKYLSGGLPLERPLSSGTQFFDTNKERWPVNKPVRKLEALWQTAGEAMYSNDIPHMRDEVWAAFVPATIVLAKVAQIDATEALALPGVVAFYSAKDVPGVNSFVTPGAFTIDEDEELFVRDTVRYHSQPVGVVLAKTNELANNAVERVKILYEHDDTIRKVEATLQDALSRNEIEASLDDSVTADSIESSTRTLRGHLELAGQFHFSLEPQTTVSIPHEDGLRMYCSTQYMDLVQTSVARALIIPANKVEIIVRRTGGGFGNRISRCSHVAVACAVACWLSHRPVRFVQSIESNMRVDGKRFPCKCNYSLSVNDQGKMQSASLSFYEDMGNSINENPIASFVIPSLTNCYNKPPTWNVNGTPVLTDAPSNSYLRAPGTLEGIAMIENIMEHISRVVNMDPIDVRINNIPSDSPMQRIIPEFLNSTEYRQRKKDINAFNEENRWRKRGIAISLMRFGIIFFGQISASVAIYHHDGTVVISHGGIEMGQGINTKAAQVAAYTLAISEEMVTVHASNNFHGANSVCTGGSITSETVCFAVRKACNEILARMKPVRDSLNDPTWPELVKKCHEKNINLISNQNHKAGDLQDYDVWGLACTEIEVDILTGRIQISRVDILEDTGESLSPLIDVGQVEGAFILGLGYWLTEKLVYDSQTGELTTANTWEYKIPGAKDIPIDFRVSLWQKRPNPVGFLRSKTTGEMATSMGISTVFALRHALDSARKDAGLNDWYHLGAPSNIETVVLSAGHCKGQFKLN